jgi:predicted DNA-binding protein
MSERLEMMINARLPLGTDKRIDRVLRGGELRSAFIRNAIEAELARREDAQRKQPLSNPYRGLGR